MIKNVITAAVLITLILITIGFFYHMNKIRQSNNNPCAAEKLTEAQKAYVKYKKAVGVWAYETGNEVDFEYIDSVYYSPLNR